MEFEGRQRLPLRLDMAPLIDVVFLLLIFFMLTSSFMVQEAINMVLPESQTAESGIETDISVIISEDREIRLNGKLIELENLQVEIEPLIVSQETPIYLHSDQNIPVKDMLAVMDEIRLAGGKNISIATRRSEP